MYVRYVTEYDGSYISHTSCEVMYEENRERLSVESSITQSTLYFVQSLGSNSDKRTLLKFGLE